MKVTVCERTVRGVLMWCVDAHLVTGRSRQFFPSKRAAETAASTIRDDNKAGAAWAGLTDRERAELASLHREAVAEGVTLAVVMRQWRQWRAERPVESKLTLGDAVHQCCAAKVASGRRPAYVEALRGFFRVFAKGREATPLSRIGPHEVREWISRPMSLGYRATWVARLSTLFAWAVRAGYLQSNPCDSVESIRVETNPVECLTVEQCADLLTWCRETCPRYLALLTLQLFCGLRPDEAEQIEWTDVDLTDGTVRIEAAKTKVRSRRIVQMTPAAVAWMRDAKRVKSVLPVTPVSGRRFTRAMRERLRLKRWPVKLLRKTAASYLMSAWQDAGRVAEQLGHSAGVLLRNYRALVKRADAERWLGLMP